MHVKRQKETRKTITSITPNLNRRNVLTEIILTSYFLSELKCSYNAFSMITEEDDDDDGVD